MVSRCRDGARRRGAGFLFVAPALLPLLGQALVLVSVLALLSLAPSPFGSLKARPSPFGYGSTRSSPSNGVPPPQRRLPLVLAPRCCSSTTPVPLRRPWRQQRRFASRVNERKDSDDSNSQSRSGSKWRTSARGRIDPELVVESPATRRIGSSAGILKSVVKVFCTDVRPNFALPWQMEQQESSFSSGFVIAGNRILTNAHGVAWRNVVRVRKHGDSRKFVATVEHVAHECDLALLRVEDPQFWSGLEPLELGDLPDLQDKIMVVGYPHGGDRISITQGIVSRVEMGSYSHSGEYLLMIQIDAAINSGNSGGPALNEDGKIVGVAFQALDEAENIGYIIPNPIIDHFLQDIEVHGKYTGFCRLGVSWQTTENEALRQYLQLVPPEDILDEESKTYQGDAILTEENEDVAEGENEQGFDDYDLLYDTEYEEETVFDDTGVLITHVEPKMPTADILKSGDVIVELDGVPIASDGTVPFRGEERVLFSHLLRSKFPGDTIDVTLIRNGERIEETIELQLPPQLVPWYMYDKYPSYLVYCGLVFTPLSVPYLMAEFGHRWQRYAPVGLLAPSMYGVVEDPGEEVVVLTQVMASDATTGYEDINNVKVISCNGQRVKSLRQLLKIIEENQEPFVRFEVGNSPSTSMQLILNAEDAERETEEVLEQNKIPDQMSADLKRWVEEGMPEKDS
mmetsp:Transcript_5326/g.12968  ORF Transcript_5326/g.12968 Transcript_5326/m.12968 type:complete len:684 (-) Transcript_5326:163-2214(-)